MLTLAGCARSSGPVVYAPGPDRPAANLVLGPSPEHTWLAETFAYRSSWPSVESGYSFDDVSTYTEVIYDDQSFYDTPLDGGYTHAAVSVRTGVLIRR